VQAPGGTVEGDRGAMECWRSMRPWLGLGAAFLIGSIPFSNIAARLTRGVDLRGVDNGTVSGSSLYRVAGFGPLAAAGVLEVGKGAVGPLIAGRDHPVAAALAAGLCVAGHNWSPFLRGAGGRGLSPAIGALGVAAWPGSLVLLAGMAGGKIVGQAAPGSLLAQAALIPVLARARGRRGALFGAAVLAPMVVKRLLGNAPVVGRRPGRVYLTRLLLDRDER
jgi:acyl phosphate:glycerol-3-phosphate acyltransferase